MRLLALLLVVGLLVSESPAASHAAEPPFHEFWRADRSTGFDGWALHGTRVADGRLVLNAATAGGGADVDGLTLPAGAAGLAVGPVRETSAPFQELIPSWNAETPPGTWIEVRLRARLGAGPDGRWTRWYDLGSWSLDSGPERRQSVKGQRDEDGRVSTDTVILATPASAYQLGLTLRADDATTSSAHSPSVSLAAVLASTPSETARPLTSGLAAWGATLDVPERSQMIYLNGGPVWCSPTSTSMVMAYWSERLGEPSLNRPVPEVAAAVYDVVYRGNGNWPFNTAYAGRDGLVAYVSRMSSMGQVERWIEAGVPVVASLAWSPGELRNAAVPSTDGHLLVIVGFTPDGDVVVNDPAADPRLGLSVRRVYPRATMERLWLTHSGGTVYLIYPESLAPPSADLAFGAW
ncbi:MAG TPA: C39 family peptidase [Chloroflexota bacterium]|nr:C39 family peptidase [Chloroflexota bacterium]